MFKNDVKKDNGVMLLPAEKHLAMMNVRKRVTKRWPSGSPLDVMELMSPAKLHKPETVDALKEHRLVVKYYSLVKL